MSIEVQMYLHIIFIVGVVFSSPLIYRVFSLLGMLIVNKVYPVTTIKLEIEGIDGAVETKIVQLSDTDDLVQAILRAKEVRCDN